MPLLRKMILLRRMRSIVLACVLGCSLHPVPAFPQTAPVASVRQSLDDAWWTGPMLANSAGTLPPGHFLVEPYLYDISSAHSDSYGSRTYILYGLANRLTVGVIPVLGYNTMNGGAHSSHVGIGDFTLLAQYQLTQFHEGSWLPTIAVEVQETFPTGKYDRLGDRPADGFGSGVHTTTLQLNTQTYFWVPNGRILRMRFDISQAFSSNANIEDVSVYGTGPGFRGKAKPGSAFFADLSWEYSLTRSWVLALDLTYSHSRRTRVIGSMPDADGPLTLHDIRLDSGSVTAFGFTPAIEYNWNSNIGVLLGTRVISGGRHTDTSVTPAVALNMVF
ncbi:MAG TPA: transporter [Rhodanobacter sp.]|nr:transporter [Rhodanobacter sp.]